MRASLVIDVKDIVDPDRHGFTLQVFLFVFMMLVSISEAQKGGAKAGMRRGGRNGGRGGSSRRGGSNHAADTGMDSLGGGSGRRACVGLCYLRLT